MSKSEEFVKQLIANRDYWLNTLLPTDSPKDVVDGFIHSLLVMFDGDSGLNDFHPLTIIDTVDEQPIDDGRYLHEIFHELNREEK